MFGGRLKRVHAMKVQLRRGWCLVLLGVCWPLVTYCADDERTQQKSLEQIRTRIEQITAKLERMEGEKSALSQELAEIETRYGKIAHHLRQMAEDYRQKRAQLTQIQQAIVQKRQRVAHLAEELGQQVRAAYGMGQAHALKLILNQQDPLLSSRMMVYYAYFNRKRLDKINAMRSELRQLAELEQKMTDESRQLDAILADKQSEQGELATALRARKALLAKLESAYSGDRQELTQLQQNEQRLQRLIVSLRAVVDDFPASPVAPATTPFVPDEFPNDTGEQSFAQLQGRLAWPVRGKLKKTFGSQRTEGSWDGVLIETQEGADIRAVSRGRVVYADWLRGYGLLMILDHGQGYMTLYAFNQTLYKSPGDWVETGEVIAAAGNSGGRQQAGLYFGIRKAGKPMDPVKWCRALSHDQAG